jgi:hypothetical protein
MIILSLYGLQSSLATSAKRLDSIQDHVESTADHDDATLDHDDAMEEPRPRGPSSTPRSAIDST